MGVRGIFRGLGAQPGAAVRVPDAERAVTDAIGLDNAQRLSLLDSFESSGLVWFWATDDKGALTYLSANAVAQFPAEARVLGAQLGTLVETVDVGHSDQRARPLSFLLSARTTFSEQPVRIISKGEEAAGEKAEI